MSNREDVIYPQKGIGYMFRDLMEPKRPVFIRFLDWPKGTPVSMWFCPVRAMAMMGGLLIGTAMRCILFRIIPMTGLVHLIRKVGKGSILSTCQRLDGPLDSIWDG